MNADLPFLFGWTARAAGLVLVALQLAGCEVATTRQPVGGLPAALQELQPEGVWRSGDGTPFYVRIADEAAGQIEIATVKKTEAGFELERTEVLLRRQGDALLANIRSSTKDTEEDYMFGRLALSGDTAVLTLAGTRQIRQLAREGAVGALVSTEDATASNLTVVVTNGFHRLASELAEPSGWRHLETDHPFVLIRQKAALD